MRIQQVSSKNTLITLTLKAWKLDQLYVWMCGCLLFSFLFQHFTSPQFYNILLCGFWRLPTVRTIHWHTILNMDAVHIYLMDPVIQLQCLFILMVETFCITPLIISHSRAFNASRQLILACHIYCLQLQHHKLILQHQLIKKELFLLILLIQRALVLDQDLAITYHMAPMVEVVLVGILVLMVSIIFKKGWMILILLGFGQIGGFFQMEHFLCHLCHHQLSPSDW